MAFLEIVLLGLGIGLIPAGLVLLWTGRKYVKRLKQPELVVWSGVIFILMGFLLILIVALWR